MGFRESKKPLKLNETCVLAYLYIFGGVEKGGAISSQESQKLKNNGSCPAPCLIE